MGNKAHKKGPQALVKITWIDEDIQRISQRLGITAAQVLLSWGIQRGTSVVPKSENKNRLAENISVRPPLFGQGQSLHPDIYFPIDC